MKITREIGEKGQVVIPRDIREMLNLRRGEKVVFEIKDGEVLIKSEQNPEEFLRDFFNVTKPKKNITLKEIKKILDEKYDLS